MDNQSMLNILSVLCLAGGLLYINNELKKIKSIMVVVVTTLVKKKILDMNDGISLDDEETEVGSVIKINPEGLTKEEIAAKVTEAIMKQMNKKD